MGSMDGWRMLQSDSSTKPKPDDPLERHARPLYYRIIRTTQYARRVTREIGNFSGALGDRSAEHI